MATFLAGSALRSGPVTRVTSRFDYAQPAQAFLASRATRQTISDRLRLSAAALDHGEGHAVGQDLSEPRYLRLRARATYPRVARATKLVCLDR